MTENRRIVLNIIATYGRSLFTLAVGLFTGRWLLMALGEVDYGLFGVVGGATAFIGFFNGLISAAVGRYYTYAIGEAKISGAEGLENCRKWFNTAVFLHTTIPLLLILIGYPLGEYGLRHDWLNIPPDRLVACLWVFRFTCISLFLGMVTVPFTAMYGAHQYIAELTVYSFVTTTVRVVLLYYMVSHPGDWLAAYALWGTLLSIGPQLIITVRAYQLFQECRIRVAYLWDPKRIRDLFSYAGAQFFGCFSAILRNQGIAILVNKYFTPVHNSSITVANNLSSQCYTLAGCMTGAFAPAITTAYGARDYQRVHTLSFAVCKIGVLFILIFALPLMLEVNKVMELWLVDPPQYAPRLCNIFMLAQIAERLAWGHSIALNADGRIWAYQIVVGIINFAIFPLSWIAVALGGDIYIIAFLNLLMMVGNALVLVFFARRNVQMSFFKWLYKVVVPLGILSVICLTVGSIPRFLLEASFWRVCVTTLTTEAVFLPLAWFIVLTQDERQFVSSRLHQSLNRLRR